MLKMLDQQNNFEDFFKYKGLGYLQNSTSNLCFKAMILTETPSQWDFKLVNYSTQEELEAAQASLCGPMSMTYAMSFLSGRNYFEELRLKGKDLAKGEYHFINPITGESKKYPNKVNGWNHYALLEYARNNGFEGYTFQSLDSSYSEEVITNVLKNGGTVLTSIKSNGDRSFADGHLICLKAIGGEFLSYYDPDLGEESVVSREKFFDEMNKGQYVVVYPKGKFDSFDVRAGTDWEKAEKNRMLGARPLNIEETGNKEGDVVIVGIHEDEPYYTDIMPDYQDSHGISLTQGAERFIRFNVPQKGELSVGIRLDPNRIFTEEGITESFKILNGNLSGEQQEVILPSVLLGAMGLSQNILGRIGDKPVIALHNNRDKGGKFNINDQEPGCERYINSEMHQSTFIITNNKDIFSELAKEKISCILVDEERGKNDTGILGEAVRNGIVYVNIEVSMKDRGEENGLLQTVIEAIKKAQD